MTSKERRNAKQSERAEKLFDGVVFGDQKIIIQSSHDKRRQSNRKGGLPEGATEDAMVEGYIKLLMYLLPGAIAKLSRLKDPRKQGMCDHSLETLLLYGLVMFLSHTASRRAANRDIGGDTSFEMIAQVIPGIDTMPHADTLARLLERIDPNDIEVEYEKAIMSFLNSNTFSKLNPGRCLIAIDGTQKMSRKYCFDERALTRRINDVQWHSMYALESVIILDNGIVLPLFTEILENDGEELNETKKQDCESKAFVRMADKIKRLIGKGRVIIVADGLYASGPVVSRCKANGWGFMITLKRGSMPSVWEEFEGLRKCEPENIAFYKTDEGRDQLFTWFNGIEYTYGGNNRRLSLNIVTCTEKWIDEHPRSGGHPVEMVCEYAWLSSERITDKNVERLCNDVARKRWKIENHFHIQKHQGYNYSHCFSYHWDAIKGFQSLMKFAHFINTLITFSVEVSEFVASNGVKWFIKRVWVIITIRGVKEEWILKNALIKKPDKRYTCKYNALKLVS